MGLLNKLPLTRIKIGIAKILYKVVSLGAGTKIKTIRRGGINYEVDLSEGIDLSLYLFGNFQSHVSENKLYRIPQDAIIFDVGANCGLMALQFAKAAPQGLVYAFEPTHYAFARLKKNLSLNPDMEKRIKTIQSFVSSKNEEESNITAYASWKVDGGKSSNDHPVHMGSAKATDGVGAVRLDDFVINNQITRLDFIKIDTDGHEFEVLNGAIETLKKFRPAMIFEIGLYVMKEKGIGFDFYADYFGKLGYDLMNSADGKAITLENHEKHIPAQGTIDILAIPRTQNSV